MWDQDIYIQTYQFASRAHLGQTVPDTEISYIQHLSFVSMEIMAAIAQSSESIDANLAIQCAILHDTIEDTEITYDRIVETFGKNVADGVQALTKDKHLDKKAQMADSLARIKQQPKEIGMVKMADRISNLLPPPAYWDAAKRRAYRDEAILIYQTLQETSPFLASRLQTKINAYQNYF